MGASQSYGKGRQLDLSSNDLKSALAPEKPQSISYEIIEEPHEKSAQFTTDQLKALGWKQESGYTVFTWKLPSSGEVSCKISKQIYYTNSRDKIAGGLLTLYKSGTSVNTSNLDSYLFSSVDQAKEVVEAAYNIPQ